MVSSIKRFLTRLHRQLDWLPPLLTRLIVGTEFIATGWGKLHNHDQVAGFFQTLGIPLPGAQAWLVAGTEFGCGLLLLVGLLTRLASLPLIVVMAVAILTAKMDDIEGLTDVVALLEVTYIALFVWLAVRGAGPVSVDGLVARRNLSRNNQE